MCAAKFYESSDDANGTSTNPFVALVAPQEVVAVHERLGREWARARRKVYRPLDRACRTPVSADAAVWDAAVEARGRKKKLSTAG